MDARPLTVDQADRWLPTLPVPEQQRFLRYRRPLDAHQFLIGRLMIRRWLADATGTPAFDWRFSEGDRGRPEIAGPDPQWSFNLSHSGGLVACALARTPARTGPPAADAGIGVDLEDLDRRPLSPDLIHRFCAPNEVADIERQPGPLQARRFLTYWTLKEAYLKARGLGIAVHLADLDFSLDGPHPAIRFRESLAGTRSDWAFELFQPTPRFLLSVAMPLPPGATRPAIRLDAISLEALVTS